MPRSHTKGRRAVPYEGTITELRAVVDYISSTGEMVSMPPYSSFGTIGKDGYRIIRLPIPGVEQHEKRQTAYYRTDHLAWYLTVGEWPTGWIEHVNGLRHDDAIENLVHCQDTGERWWFGTQEGTDIRRLVMVDGENGLLSEGPLTYRTEVDGKAIVKPLVSKGWRALMQEQVHKVDVDPHDEDMTLPKGEFGVDWGV